MAKHVYLLILLTSTYLELLIFATNTIIHNQDLLDVTKPLSHIKNARKIIVDADLTKFNARAEEALALCNHFYEDAIDELNQCNADVPSPELANAANSLSKLVSEALSINKATSSPSSSSSVEQNTLADDFPKWVSTGDRKLLQYSPSPSPSPSSSIIPDIVVAKDGSGTYSTICEGLDAAAGLMNGWGRIVIYVKKGVYEENVVVKNSLTNITLIGDGIDATVVTGHKSVGDGATTRSSATFSKLLS